MAPVLEAKTAPNSHVGDPYRRERRRTRVVAVGSVLVGGSYPLRLQSMTTTDTLDTAATVAQALRMVEAGCEIVRITAPTVRAARALETIRKALDDSGCRVPLVADIHFDPAAAMAAAEFVEKVRINPGNFVDSKRFTVREYTEPEYHAELGRIEERFTPLVEKLKRLGRALRIGTNHGSLSDRIMNRYGDSPLGMVESALEFVRICEKNDFYDIILSMKASNPKIMIAAYRLLAARMAALGMEYPFHLGVTEAGNGEDGRVKSAVGIGSLLEDGIGDTIRVSLTEDPEFEIPVCRDLAAPYAADAPPKVYTPNPGLPYIENCFDYKRRDTDSVKVGPFRLGGVHPVRVITRWKAPGDEILAFLEAQLQAPQALEPEILEWTISSDEDLLALREAKSLLAGETSRLAFLGRFSDPHAPWEDALPDLDMAVWSDGFDREVGARFLARALETQTPLLIESETVEGVLLGERACRAAGVACVVSLASDPQRSSLHETRRLAAALAHAGSKTPLHLKASREGLDAAVLLGAALCDGLGDSVQILSQDKPKDALRFAYNVLQAAGVRITKTEYVSCPSCGRTLFDLQKTTERIKSQTGHLKGVKIAIMGCIVNGPGEMADADFGYVGGAPGKINLYVGKECVQKGVPTADSDRALIELIRAHGKWVEPANGEAI
ncbi:MAG: 4-hydroxy-3-methylbut-2-en-1-yl diphosphate synthase [Elusimicrobia bacterium CG_4_9_14_3_um_filter_62_55]|nr:MAG: 4-hydroxy-3-methylbut-2-en-1-yl diphosphate synthase [Elusimicrobia bacterium CG22_combo_CG10-13_8_21_14_all_63_91]PJB25984.1 MAG: 4-hydroxy-3-methylbut-2-en-1-yl diphosphate synthase [Elusimicrobia bacterium CG_4_9_14_3_um_filter_62_55]